MGSGANSFWEMRLPQGAALPSQRIEPNQSWHLEGTLRRSTWCPSALHFPSSGKGKTLLPMHDGVLVRHRHTRAQGNRILKRQTLPLTLQTTGCLCQQVKPGAWRETSREASPCPAITWSWRATSCWHTGGTRRGRRWRPISRWARTWWRGPARGSRRQHQSRQSIRSPGRQQGRWGCACERTQEVSTWGGGANKDGRPRARPPTQPGLPGGKDLAAPLAARGWR